MSISNNNPSAINPSLAVDSVLHSRLDNLLRLYQQHNFQNHPEIESQENLLRETLDSVNLLKNSAINVAEKDRIDRLVFSFQTTVTSYKSVPNRSAPISNNDDQKESSLIAALQEDVRKRDNRIADLESQFKILAANKSQPIPQDLKKLQQQNELLSSSLKEQLNKNKNLTGTNNSLRKNVEQLNKRIEALRKFAGSAK